MLFIGVASGSPIEIVYVPSHLYHMVFELFKNAMRAVVEHHGAASEDYPPIEALVALGKEDISIKVCVTLFMLRCTVLYPVHLYSLLPLFPLLAIIIITLLTFQLITCFVSLKRFLTKEVASQDVTLIFCFNTCTLLHHNRQLLQTTPTPFHLQVGYECFQQRTK